MPPPRRGFMRYIAVVQTQEEGNPSHPEFWSYNITQTNSLNANPPYPVITNYPAPNSFKFEVAKQWKSVFIAAIRQIRLFTTSSHSLGAQSNRPATSDPITLHSVVACSFKSHLNSINFLKKWVKGLERWRGVFASHRDDKR